MSSIGFPHRLPHLLQPGLARHQAPGLQHKTYHVIMTMVFMKMTIMLMEMKMAMEMKTKEIKLIIPAAFPLLPLPASAAGSFSPQKRQTPDLRINLLKRQTPRFLRINLLQFTASQSIYSSLDQSSCMLSPGLSYSQDHIISSNHHILMI